MIIDINLYKQVIKYCQYISLPLLIPLFFDIELFGDVRVLRSICLTLLVIIGLGGFAVAVLAKMGVIEFQREGQLVDLFDELKGR